MVGCSKRLPPEIKNKVLASRLRLGLRLVQKISSNSLCLAAGSVIIGHVLVMYRYLGGRIATLTGRLLGDEGFSWRWVFQ